MKGTLVFAVYLFMGIWGVLPLWRQRERGEAIAVGIIILLGVWYAEGLLYHWPVPNPARIIQRLYGPISLPFPLP